MTTRTPRLTLKQRRFCQAYTGEAEGNGARAAELAGYASKRRDSLKENASRLLRMPHVRAEIDRICAEHPLVASREQRRALLAKIATGELPGTEVRDRVNALHLLLKSSGDLIERRQIEVNAQITARKAIDFSSMTAEQIRTYRAHLIAAQAILDAVDQPKLLEAGNG
jgi:hypothetical protein